MIIDFRSDTVTKPSQAMLEAMFNAKVGDDVFGEDPTINELETLAATMFGMEAALFCPSGTMTNQIAIKAHTQPGDEVICDSTSHVYLYEGGGIAVNSACSVRLINGNRGQITADDVVHAINPNDIHKPISKLVSLENTCNRGGGSCYTFAAIKAIKEVCLEHNLLLHLDGARLFNAIVANNETPAQYGAIFDSISICLSKGLGTPVGSILLGKQPFINKAKRIRKLMGGGMRQAGFLAAAGIYALQHNVDRLATDHTHATQLAAALQRKPFVKELLPVETNIIIATIHNTFTASSLVDALAKENILLFAISPTQVRFVLHLDITPEMVKRSIEVIERL